MSETKPKFVVSIINGGQSPADNGRTIHALKLAKELNDGGAEVIVMFDGQGVSWIERFAERTEDSHPFVKNYGYAFDEIRPLMRACNMCCKRFDATEAATAAAIPIDGEGRDHVNLGQLALAGYQIIHH